VSALSAVYGGVVRLRRSWYARRPGQRALLPRPVISVGNIAVGGSGKTPVVAALANVLADAGHRPAILSRGYRRIGGSGDVVIVGDGRGALVPVEQSGDEPQMLARGTRVPVIVCADRFRAGITAIERFNSTVLILDDGFQHLQLVRDVDLVVLSSADLVDRLLPAGRLREPLAAARAADAVLVYGDADHAQLVAARAGVSQSFSVTRRVLPLQPLADSAPVPAARARVAAVAGIARPERFFDDLRQTHDIAREFVYADHHWFTDADVREIEQRAREVGATAVATTAKDAVRLDRRRSAMTLPWAILPIDVSIEPGAEFELWLRQRL
jgi:tetraacyldisaccharide 4'-kinase